MTPQQREELQQAVAVAEQEQNRNGDGVVDAGTVERLTAALLAVMNETSNMENAKMHTQEELKKTIEEAQEELNVLFQATQLADAKQNRLDAIEAARVVVERTLREGASLEQKIEEAAIKVDDAIKERFESRMPYVALGVSTPVNNRAADWIGLKDALLKKKEEHKRFAARLAELVRVQENGAPKD